VNEASIKCKSELTLFWTVLLEPGHTTVTGRPHSGLVKT